jgi:hypothetical protein
MTVSEKEALAIRTAYHDFARSQNYVRSHDYCVIPHRRRQFLFIADMYRAMFKFGVFNAMQSGCFDTVRQQALPTGVCDIYA